MRNIRSFASVADFWTEVMNLLPFNQPQRRNIIITDITNTINSKVIVSVGQFDTLLLPFFISDAGDTGIIFYVFCGAATISTKINFFLKIIHSMVTLL